MSEPVVRVSVVRCKPEDFAHIRVMMVDADAILRPEIETMPGLLGFFAGADEANHALINVSFWRTQADAHRLDDFEPMLALGRQFVAEGAVFERPIMNHDLLWAFGDLARLWRRPSAPLQAMTESQGVGERGSDFAVPPG